MTRGEKLRDLINYPQKHLLWCDEIGDEFLLTKSMEIYQHSDTTLKCLCWRKRVYLQLEKMKVITLENVTDDHLYVFYADLRNLPLLLSLGMHKRRPNIKGDYIRTLKERLGHDILVPPRLRNLKREDSYYSITNGKESKIITAPTAQKARYEFIKQIKSKSVKFSDLTISKLQNQMKSKGGR